MRPTLALVGARPSRSVPQASWRRFSAAARSICGETEDPVAFAALVRECDAQVRAAVRLLGLADTADGPTERARQLADRGPEVVLEALRDRFPEAVDAAERSSWDELREACARYAQSPNAATRFRAFIVQAAPAGTSGQWETGPRRTGRRGSPPRPLATEEMVEPTGGNPAVHAILIEMESYQQMLAAAVTSRDFDACSFASSALNRLRCEWRETHPGSSPPRR